MNTESYSEADPNLEGEMDETTYLLSSPANAESLRASIRELDADKGVQLDWAELLQPLDHQP